jgi:hypothetical protein
MANLKRYDVFTCQCGCDNIDYAESVKGEWVKFADAKVENFNSLQQLKAEIALSISVIARDSSIPAVDRLDKIVVLVNEQLSAV